MTYSRSSSADSFWWCWRQNDYFDTHQIFRRNGREKAILSSRQTIAKAEAIGAEKFQFEVSFFFIFVNWIMTKRYLAWQRAVQAPREAASTLSLWKMMIAKMFDCFKILYFLYASTKRGCLNTLPIKNYHCNDVWCFCIYAFSRLESLESDQPDKSGVVSVEGFCNTSTIWGPMNI